MNCANRLCPRNQDEKCEAGFETYATCLSYTPVIPDLVTVDRNSLKVLMTCAANLCREHTPARVDQLRRAIKRITIAESEESHEQRDKRQG